MDFLGWYCIQLGMRMTPTLRFTKWWCSSTGSSFAFLDHIASSCIHMYHGQISYINEIEFFIYRTCDHLVDFSYDSVLYQRHLQPPLEKFLPLPLELFLPLSLPRLMDDCVANAPSNDVLDLLIFCS